MKLQKSFTLQQIFYDPKDRGGFFGYRLRTINRSLGNSSRNSYKIAAQSDQIVTEDEEIADHRDDIAWLKQACPKNNTKEIFIRMRKTIACRPTIFTFEEFPRFLDTAGLVRNLFFIYMRLVILKWFTLFLNCFIIPKQRPKFHFSSFSF